MRPRTGQHQAWRWTVGAGAMLLLVSLAGCGSGEDGTLPGDGSGASGTGNGGAGGLSMTGTGGTGAGSSSGGNECSGVLPARIRDFQQDHPDFETFSGTEAYTGIVESDLGPDGKPVYAHPGATAQTTGPDQFAEWYQDTDGVNQGFDITIQLSETSPGEFTYDNSAFFPVDDEGWGNQGNPHNFHFTTEVHTLFTYEGGEEFTFTGDDDLWLFINGRLAIDLGGLHPQLSDTIDLDDAASELGITVGHTYPMDIFHAERHTDESNFRIQTSIACFTPPPPR